MTDSPPIVVYHANCSDGFCAAWLFQVAFPNAEFISAYHGQRPPTDSRLAGRRVFVVDFSYPRDVTLRMASACSSLTIIDHHKTAEADLAGLEAPGLSIAFDMDKSGGRLAWEYLWSNGLLPDTWLSTLRSDYAIREAPWLVCYTEDRDLWRWELAYSREINAALRSRPMTFEEWDYLHERGRRTAGMAELVAEGRAILRSEKQIVDTHVRNAVEAEIGGHRVLCVNATVLFSEIAGELAQGRPFGACYFDRSDGKRQFSLRSREGGIDVSEVAKAMGGGGHRNAAGFEATAPVVLAEGKAS